MRPFERLKERNDAKKKAEGKESHPTDPIFPKTHRDLFHKILQEENRKKDREGLPRTAYSLRLMEVPTFTRSRRTAAPASR